MMKLAIFALFVCISLANAENDKKDAQAVRQCYVCNENTDQGCGDPFSVKENYLKNCENGEQFCRKTIQFGNY